MRSRRRMETGAIPEDRARVEAPRRPGPEAYFVTFASSTMTGYA